MTIPERRIPRRELAPLFVVDAAIVAAQRILSVHLDPSSVHPGGARYPPTRALLEAMRTLRGHIREHRRDEQAFVDGIGHQDDATSATSASTSEKSPF